MKDELDKKLCERFPVLYEQRHWTMDKTGMCWGFPGDGWFDLIWDIGLFVENSLHNARNTVIYEYKKAKNLPFTSDLSLEEIKDLKVDEMKVTAVQVKEKFGGLRFYWTSENLPRDYYERIAGAIDFAEMMSYRICEVCGNKGECNNEGWLSTMCTPCREAEIKARLEKRNAKAKTP